jgi:hypothetical protein
MPCDLEADRSQLARNLDRAKYWMVLEQDEERGSTPYPLSPAVSFFQNSRILLYLWLRLRRLIIQAHR